jgi:glycosyltransferase involved in cell wall biosynthesis
MSGVPLTYAVVTPVRNEEENLQRLFRSLAEQTVPPRRWIIVDNGSTDGTSRVGERLAATNAWITLRSLPGDAVPQRGAPVVRAFHAGLEAVSREDVVVKLDADVSFRADYFELLLAAFAADEELGIASGSAQERDEGGLWQHRHVTGSSVWGAARAYRRACLNDVLPLEERSGWDGIDELKAAARGWRTATLVDLPFRHHRREGERDGAAWKPWYARGRAAHYMGYRPWYLVLRAMHHAHRDPVALAMVYGFARAAIARECRCPDPVVRTYLRERQSISFLASRRREALGEGDRQRADVADRTDVLLVCSGGGHLLQLSSLRAAWEGYSSAWVVASHEGSDVRSLLAGESVTHAHYPTTRHPANLVRNLALAWRTLGRLHPKVIVTTGAGVAVPFAWVARLRRVRVVYVESLARTEAPSLSCRLVAPVADRVYVQWPDLIPAIPAARYSGTVFSRSS